MAWLQKRPQVSNPSLFYTVGLSKTLVIVGLGNPGPEYDQTRHNIGFFCVDEFVSKHDDLSAWQRKKDLFCFFSSGQIGDTRVIVIKPETFMNESGQAVAAVVRFYKVPASQVLVVHDELDIPFGQIRLRQGGSSAGHNGIKSVSSHIGEDYGRVRIGIGPKKPAAIDSADFVLKAFSKQEQTQLANLRREATAILSEYVYSGGLLPQETRSFLV